MIPIVEDVSKTVGCTLVPVYDLFSELGVAFGVATALYGVYALATSNNNPSLQTFGVASVGGGIVTTLMAAYVNTTTDAVGSYCRKG